MNTATQTRLTTQDPALATGKAAELFAGIRKAAGKVPNAYAGIGTNSPNALEAYLAFDAAARKGTLAAKEQETIRLAVSEVAGCDYCLAAHTVLGKRAGLSPEAVQGARQGTPTGDAKLDALATFARTVAGTRGTVPAEVVEGVRAAGYTDAQIVDALHVMTTIHFTNLFNRVNDTVLDFPAA